MSGKYNKYYFFNKKKKKKKKRENNTKKIINVSVARYLIGAGYCIYKKEFCSSFGPTP